MISGRGIFVRKYFVTGASEGGAIAALSLENDPTYSGGVAVCGPIGSFQKQLNYIGDVRVLFDYFFPKVLTTDAGESAIDIPPRAAGRTGQRYTSPPCSTRLSANPLATLQLISAAQIPIGLDLRNAPDAIVGSTLVQHLRHQRRQGDSRRESLRQHRPRLSRLVQRCAAQRDGRALRRGSGCRRQSGQVTRPRATCMIR